MIYLRLWIPSILEKNITWFIQVCNWSTLHGNGDHSGSQLFLFERRVTNQYTTVKKIKYREFTFAMFYRFYKQHIEYVSQPHTFQIRKMLKWLAAWSHENPFYLLCWKLICPSLHHNSQQEVTLMNQKMN